MASLFELLIMGGWFMLPIIVASLLGVAFFVERLLYLRRDRMLSPQIRAAAPGLLERRDRQALLELCTREGTPLGRVLARGLEQPHASTSQMRETMEDAGRRELQLMKQYLGALNSVANVSPLLGLLGTVVGMIVMFQGVVATAATHHGSADVGTLADGIWQALLTTAAGLIVAIPVTVAHRYLLGRIDRVIAEIEDFGRELIHKFASDAEQEGAP